MADDDQQEKSEEASPKRLEDAREKGQVPRSRELTTLGILVTGGAGFAYMGPDLIESLLRVMRNAFQPQRSAWTEPDRMMLMFMDASFDALLALLPLLALLTVAAALIPMMLGGWNFSVKALSFQWDKIDPIKGLGRIFSIKGLVELLKALAKFSFMGAVGGTWLWHSSPEYLGLGSQPLGEGLGTAAAFVLTAFLISISPMAVIAAIDVPFQLWEYSRQMRMSRRDVKDESKDTDGNPELKAKIRRQQQDLAQRRMMEAIPDADVIIVNPTHYSVALNYKADGNRAPILVASGVDLIAFRIREIAKKHGVIQVDAPLLARALYFNVKLNTEIPTALFAAVAQVLAYVYRLRKTEPRSRHAVALGKVEVPTGFRTD